MNNLIYPQYFYQDNHVWLDDGLHQWQTHFKIHHMRNLQQRRRAWFETVIKMNRDADYVMISEIIIRDKLYHPDPDIAS